MTAEIRSLYALPALDQTIVTLELAGVGNRLLAALIDLAITSLLMLLALAIALVARLWNADLSESLYYLLPFCVWFGTSFLQEWLWNGRSVGKALLRIRVARVNGQPIGVWEALGRNLFRLVDVWFMGIGLLAILFLPHERRFGDWLAGTIVINDQTVSLPSLGAGTELTGPVRAPSPTMPSFQEAGRRLTLEEGDLLADYLTRRPTLTRESAAALGRDLNQYFMTRTRLAAEDPAQAQATADPLADKAALENLFWGFRQAQRQQRRGERDAAG